MVIKNKKTLLFLIGFIVLFLVGIFMLFNNNIDNGVICIISGFLCLYFFIKFNMRSQYLNPNHPKK